ncbi:GGDEF domain-containing protein [Mangrovibacter plantisponsor]|uniref:diguanylate cyclase n=1 Tax=Mangrovibacter plantisponsor TaxID=451513 RepID=A0A317Q4S5_9ENTR|nr:membrane-associated sensor domain-containing protein [Mangrovibacter plantisponsor]PWW10765.1 diguanylate cyclase (GGDEF)-like protein [Mangrovibacter plantisponsor]
MFRRKVCKAFDLRYEQTRQHAIIMSANWFLWVNLLFSIVILVRYYFNPSVNLAIPAGHADFSHLPLFAVMVISAAVLYMLKYSPDRLSRNIWTMLRVTMLILSLNWCLVLFLLFASGGRPVIFALASILLLTGLIALYVDALAWFLFSVPLQAAIIITSLVFTSYITVVNVLAYIALALLVESARRMLNTWFVLAIHREQENNDLIQRLEIQANCDPLTGLANRRAFQVMLDKAVQRASFQQGDSTFSMLMLDVDKFKNYNDFYGHQAGDSCLIQVAESIENAVRANLDLVGRFGGEEFIVLLPQASATDAADIAKRIQSALSMRNIEHMASDVTNKVTVSIGIAEWSPGLTASQLVSRADSALYYAKHSGRNQYQMFYPANNPVKEQTVKQA